MAMNRSCRARTSGAHRSGTGPSRPRGRRRAGSACRATCRGPAWASRPCAWTMTAAPGTGFPSGSRTRPTTNIRPGAGVGSASSAFAAADGAPAGEPLDSMLRAGTAEPAARDSNTRATNRGSRLNMARMISSGGAAPGGEAEAERRPSVGTHLHCARAGIRASPDSRPIRGRTGEGRPWCDVPGRNAAAPSSEMIIGARPFFHQSRALA